MPEKLRAKPHFTTVVIAETMADRLRGLPARRVEESKRG